MEYTLKQIAQYLGGTIEGDGSAKIRTITKIEEGFDGSLTFLANPKYTNYIYTTKATAVIVNKEFVAEKPISAVLIRVDDAYSSFAKLLEFYNTVKHDRKGISKKSSISKTAKIGKNVFIGDFVHIGDHVVVGDNTKIYHNVTIHDNVKIGNECIIFSGVVLMDFCIVGNKCTLCAGCVIGADGFGFAPIKDGHYIKVPQTGNVIIEDDVEIGANTTIDRATMGSTVIKKGTKLDNLVQIAHNCEVGPHTVIAGQTGVSGSTKIGANCLIGGQVGIAGHITIGNNSMLGAQSGIISSVPEGSQMMGSPAFDAKKYKRSYVYFMNLEKLTQRINQLERDLKELRK